MRKIVRYRWGPSLLSAMEDKILDDARQIADLTYFLRMVLAQIVVNLSFVLYGDFNRKSFYAVY